MDFSKGDINELVNTIYTNGNCCVTTVLSKLDLLIESKERELAITIQNLALEDADANCWPVENLKVLNAEIKQNMGEWEGVMSELATYTKQLKELESRKSQLEQDVCMLEKYTILEASLKTLSDLIGQKCFSSEMRRVVDVVTSIKLESGPAFFDTLLKYKEAMLNELKLQLKEAILEDENVSFEIFDLLFAIDKTCVHQILEEKLTPLLAQYNVQFDSRMSQLTKEDAVKSIESFHMRRHWLNGVDYDSIIGLYPEEWNAKKIFFDKFCGLTRNHLIQLLDIKYCHDIQQFYEIVQKVQALEAEIVRISGDPNYDLSLRKLFDQFTLPWYNHFNSEFAKIIKTAFTSKDSFERDSTFNSAISLCNLVQTIERDQESLGIHQMIDDGQVLIEKYLDQWLTAAAKILERWKESAAFCLEQESVKDCPFINGWHWPFQSGSLRTSPSGDEFMDLIYVNASLDYIWHRVKTNFGAPKLHQSRLIAHQTLILHFVYTTFIPMVPGSYEGTVNFTEFLNQWQLWLKSIDSHMQDTRVVLCRDTTVFIYCWYAKRLLKTSNVADKVLLDATAILEWLTAYESSIAATNEVTSVLNQCKGFI